MAEPQPDDSRVAALRSQLASEGQVELETSIALLLAASGFFLGGIALMAILPNPHSVTTDPHSPAMVLTAVIMGFAALAIVPSQRQPVRVDERGIHLRTPWRYCITWPSIISVDLWQPGPGYGPRWATVWVDPDSPARETAKGWWPRCMARLAQLVGVGSWMLPRFRFGNATVVAFLAAEAAERHGVQGPSAHHDSDI